MHRQMEADDREERGRRGLLWFRVSFYPLALALGVVLLLHGRASGDDELIPLVGRTDQGEEITLTLAGSRPHALWTRIVGVCPTGARRPVSWTPADGLPVPFHVDGSRLRVEETNEEAWPGGIRGHVATSLDGEVHDDRAQGTLDSTETITWRDGRSMICSSGPVRFTVAADR